MFYQAAGIDDADVLAELRRSQLIKEGIVPTKDIDSELLHFFTKKLADNTLVEWMGIDNNAIIATAAIAFYAPSDTNESGIVGYITNLFTAPGYQDRGIEAVLLDKLMAEARARNVEKVWLGTQKLDPSIYLKYGFREAEEWLELSST